MCFRVRIVRWLWCSNISKTNSDIMFFPWPLLPVLVLLTTLCCYLIFVWFSSAPTFIVCSVIQCSFYDYWIILCIAHWNCISVSVHVIFYFEILLAFMFIFETENSIKLSSHNTGQINHPISFLFKKNNH